MLEKRRKLMDASAILQQADDGGKGGAVAARSPKPKAAARARLRRRPRLIRSGGKRVAEHLISGFSG
jgi:nitrous oxide reductase